MAVIGACIGCVCWCKCRSRRKRKARALLDDYDNLYEETKAGQGATPKTDLMREKMVGLESQGKGWAGRELGGHPSDLWLPAMIVSFLPPFFFPPACSGRSTTCWVAGSAGRGQQPNHSRDEPDCEGKIFCVCVHDELGS